MQVPFLVNFEVRWSDLDPNRHLANSAYAEYMSHIRIKLLGSFGVTQNYMHRHNIGPVIFSEEFHYLREILPQDKIVGDVELLGASKDHRFTRFAHSLFNDKGRHVCYSQLTFGWIDLTKRKLIVPPGEIIRVIGSMPRSPYFLELTKKNTFHPTPVPAKSLDLETHMVHHKKDK